MSLAKTSASFPVSPYRSAVFDEHESLSFDQACGGHLGAILATMLGTFRWTQVLVPSCPGQDVVGRVISEYLGIWCGIYAGVYVAEPSSDTVADTLSGFATTQTRSPRAVITLYC
jgi:hypothetical protein